MKSDKKKGNIKILVIGNDSFIKSLHDNYLINLQSDYIIEAITDEKSALKRLNHNSYDILLIEDRI